MKRDLIRLAKKSYDVAIIGGGIYGACIAWDATLRGLSVVLVEKGDFGGATSANSHKIIHGGLRYLQHGDFGRIRESIRERRTLMRIAPHLVHPLLFLIPTYGYGMRGKRALGVAMRINDLCSFDRNWQQVDPQKYLPRSRVISKNECLRLVPDLEDARLTGGALWFDGQVHHAERLVLSFLLSAVEQGAEVANYTEVTGFIEENNSIHGIRVYDEVTRNTFDISAKIVVNTSGPWVNQILSFLQKKQREEVHFCKAVVLVTRQLLPHIAFGVYGKKLYRDVDALLHKGPRLFFITPWRNTSLVGTFYVDEHQEISEKEIQRFLDEINAMYPAAVFTRQDVYGTYQGLLPITKQDLIAGDFLFPRKYHIEDHTETDGLEGLISVVGVKLSTARDVAEKTVNLVLHKLRQPFVPCRTSETRLVGGDIERFEDFLKAAIADHRNQGEAETVTHLVYQYGTVYSWILDKLQARPELGQRISSHMPVLQAEIVHAVQEEMALHLSDVILHRTVLGSNGLPKEGCLRTCAQLMAEHLGWDEARMQQEIDITRASFIAQITVC